MSRVWASGWLVGTVLGGLLLAGCPGSSGPAGCRAMMQSENPHVRAKGCKLAGQSADTRNVVLLVDRLEDRDAAVRLMAGRALMELTGENFGYRAHDPPEVRAEAVARWRAYANGSPDGGRR